MGILLSPDAEFNDENIKTAIDLKISLEISTHSLPKKTQEFISLLLSKYLEECNISNSFNKLEYCVSELLFNAIKANLKRIYFHDKNLDITNPDDYKEGMIHFRTETLVNKEYYFEKLREQDLYVIFSLKLEKRNLILEVRNNSLITPFELARVRDKIENFHQMTLDEIDQSEGAGLGINSIILALKSFGLSEKNYQLTIEENETVARLIYTLPTN